MVAHLEETSLGVWFKIGWAAYKGPNNTIYGYDPYLAIPKWYPKLRASLPSTVSPTCLTSLLMSTFHGKQNNKHKTIATVMGLVYVACVLHIGWNNALLSQRTR